MARSEQESLAEENRTTAPDDNGIHETHEGNQSVSGQERELEAGTATSE